MKETPINIKIKAALLIASIDKKSGHTALNNLLKNSKNQSLFITSLKSNFFGMRYLTEAYKTQKILPNQLSSVDKSLMLSILRKEASFFRKTVTNAKAKENKNANEQIHQLSSAYNKKGGDAVQGELFSATCIACHQIGSKGINLAPALGGYKSRDPEHLLTAIIKPNAAIEKGYELYRIVTKNGEIASGFLFNKSDFGTTIATVAQIKPLLSMSQKRFRDFNQLEPNQYSR